MFDLQHASKWYLLINCDPLVTSVVRIESPVGSSILQALEQTDAPLDYIEVFWNGQNVPRDMWHMLRPKEGNFLHVVAVPGGPVAGLAVGLAGAALGSWVAGSAAVIGILGELGAAILGAAITLAAQYAATALMTPDTSSNADKDDPVYSFAGARNQLKPFQAVPVVLGGHRFTPPLAAPYYVEGAGDAMYLRMLVCWGRRYLVLDDLRIGNTPIWDYEGVEIEHQGDSNGSFDLYPAQVRQEDFNILLEENVYATRNTEPDANEASCTISFPQGIYKYDDDGDKKSAGAHVWGEYREAGSDGAWTLFFDHGFKAKTTQPLYYEARAVFPHQGEWELRFTRDVDDTGDGPRAEAAYWTNTKSITYGSPVNALGDDVMALRIKASGELNGVVDQLNAMVYRVIPVWNGSDWNTWSTTKNPAAICRWLLTGECNSESANTPPDDDSLAVFYEYCEALGLQYSRVLETQTSLAELFDEVAAAGFGSRAINGNKWGVVIDTYRSYVTQHFTARNVKNFSGAITYPDIVHGVRVQFLNEDEDYAADEIIAYDDGYSAVNATKFITMRPRGITKYWIAYWFGRYFLASMRLRPEQFTFDTDFEYIACKRGDLVHLAHDVMLVGLGQTRVKSVSGTTLVLEDEVVFDAGKTYGLRIRTEYGDTANSIVTAAGLGSTSTVYVANPSTGVKAGDLVMFGEYGQETIRALVQDIKPTDDHSATLTCIPYNEAVYDAYNSIPEYEAVVSSPVSASLTGPLAPLIVDVVSDEGALPTDVSGRPVPTILLTLQLQQQPIGNTRVTPPRHWRVGYKKSSEESYAHFTIGSDKLEARVTDVEPKVAYDLVVQAVDNEGRLSSPAKVSGHMVQGLGAKPPAVDTLRSSINGSNCYLEWTYPSIVGDVVAYEIRWHKDQDVTTWSEMVPLSDAVPRDARSYTVPSTTGSYAIKAIDALGLRSDTTKCVNAGVLSEPPALVAVEYTEQSGDFPGAKESCGVDGTALVMVKDVPMSEWLSLARVTSLANYEPASAYWNYVAEASSIPDPTADRWRDEDCTLTPGPGYSTIESITGSTPRAYYLADVVSEVGDEWSCSVEVYVPDPSNIDGWIVFMGGADMDASDPDNNVTLLSEWDPVDSDITVLGDGWYRFRMSATDTTGTGTVALGVLSDTAQAGDTLRVRNFMLTQGLDFLAYQSSDDQSNTQVGVDSQAYYYFLEAQDLGAVYDVTARWDVLVTAFNLRDNMAQWVSLAALGSLVGDASGDEYAVRMEASYSRDDVASGMTWTDWAPFQVGQFTARHIKLRLSMRTTDAFVSPAVSKIHATLELPTRQEYGEDAVSGAGAKTVTFNNQFYAAPSVYITAQDMQSGDYYELSKTAAGFTVTFRNSGGTAVSRTFDWQANGAGKVT